MVRARREPLLTAEAGAGVVALLAEACFPGRQHAARPLSERRPAKFRRAAILIWAKVANARKVLIRGIMHLTYHA
jgi:hypothetical protein